MTTTVEGIVVISCIGLILFAFIYYFKKEK